MEAKAGVSQSGVRWTELPLQLVKCALLGL
jgi:hypothetical protein